MPLIAPVMITKQTDSTSVPLALHSASAKMFPEVKLEITTNRDNASIVIYRLKLTNARVVSYATATSVSGSGGGSMFDEVGFFYDTITWMASGSISKDRSWGLRQRAGTCPGTRPVRSSSDGRNFALTVSVTSRHQTRRWRYGVAASEVS